MHRSLWASEPHGFMARRTICTEERMAVTSPPAPSLRRPGWVRRETILAAAFLLRLVLVAWGDYQDRHCQSLRCLPLPHLHSVGPPLTYHSLTHHPPTSSLASRPRQVHRRGLRRVLRRGSLHGIGRVSVPPTHLPLHTTPGRPPDPESLVCKLRLVP